LLSSSNLYFTMPVDSKELPVYDVDTVSRHNTPEDGWIVIRGVVYDITKFSEFHPGGKSILFKNLGTDVSEAFMEPSIHAHSDKAWRMLERYKIGTTVIDKKSAEASLDPRFKGLADVNAPLVWQVVNMEPSIYQEWVHNYPPVYSIRLFQSQFCEFFSRYPWWYILPLWLPIVSYNFISSALLPGANFSNILTSFACGLLFWTAIEYFAHRFLFHMDTSSKWGNFYHFMAHGIHHLSPMDPDRLVFPPIFSVFAVAFVYKVTSIFPIPFFGAFFAGGLLGFVAYDTCHYLFHHGTICDKVSYLKSMRSRHFRHHYSCPNKNYGVSSPLWDIILGTSE